MEENIQELLKDKNEDIVQFNFENNTSSPVAIDLFDTASLLTTPTSGNTQTNYTSSGDLFPLLPPSILAENPNNGTFIASDLSNTSPVLRLINTTTNTTENTFNNSVGFDAQTSQYVIQPDGNIIVVGQFTSYKTSVHNRIVRLKTNGFVDSTFDNSIGFNGITNGVALQPDGKIIVVGQFTQYKGISENGIIRLNSDGTKDLTFDNSIGFFGGAVSVELQTDGKIICVGNFTTYKGISANKIIRLNSDGTIDTSFVYGIGFTSTLLGLTGIAIQTDGKILIGGDFTQYQGVTNNKIIRLNSDGSKDLTFNNSVGFNTGFGFLVNRFVLQPDGKIICFGSFTQYKGLTENRIIRLNSDGSKDLTFDNSVGFGINATLCGALQPDGKIIVVGQFSSYKGVTANNIIRLNSDGSIDLTFDISIGFDSRADYVSVLSDGSIICVGVFNSYNNYLNNSIIKLNSNGQIISTLNLGDNLTDIIYNSNNNVFYGIDVNDLYIINSDGQSIQNIFPLGGQSITYNPNNNYLYILQAGTINVCDCATNTLITTIVLGGISSFLSEVTSSNEIYFFNNSFNLLQKIDCLTNTLVLINLPLPNVSTSVRSISYYNGYLYLMNVSTNIIDIVDTNTDTYFTSITIPAIYNFLPYYSTINPITNQLFITNVNALSSKQYAVIDLPTNTFVSVNLLGGTGRTYGVIYSQLSNSMYISGSLFSVVTFTASPFFIGGSTNYNTFVNSLNFEPIFIEEIRILSQSQTQLYNQVQFTKIDSNGNQIFFPEFPITKVDVNQEQGNIAELKLNGLVFDGRTYINQYVINPSEIVSFEIIYKQLDRFSATPTFPIFFKPKIQLKEYIRKDYSSYDVEM
jgi:uncharacterized delta-60 repeat protein